MSGFLRRSLLQFVASVVLFAGAGAADLFADTTYTVAAAAAGGPTPPDIVCSLELETVINGMPVYAPVAGNQREMMTLHSSTSMGFMNMYTHILKYPWTGLTPGRKYRSSCEIRTGLGPLWTYVPFENTSIWTQP